MPLSVLFVNHRHCVLQVEPRVIRLLHLLDPVVKFRLRFFEDAIEHSRVLTPGTVLEEGMLSARRNNWLAAVVVELAQQVLDQLAA